MNLFPCLLNPMLTRRYKLKLFFIACLYIFKDNNPDSDFTKRVLPWVMYFIGGVAGWVGCGVLYGIYFS